MHRIPSSRVDVDRVDRRTDQETECSIVGARPLPSSPSRSLPGGRSIRQRRHRSAPTIARHGETHRDVDVSAIRNGCVVAWQGFVESHSNLILKVLRHILFIEDCDEIHGVYVDLLHDLYDHKLTEYDGRAALSTWLVCVTRGYAYDYLRHKRGRPRPPHGYDQLCDLERRVYHWHFVEGNSYGTVLELLNWGREKTTAEQLVATIESIEGKIDPRTLRRLDRERAARDAGHRSLREMEYFLHARQEYLRWCEASGNEVVHRMEAERIRGRLAAIKAALPPREREVVDLRFDEGLTAKEIASRVGGATPRRVYSMIESALKAFRSELRGFLQELEDTGG